MIIHETPKRSGKLHKSNRERKQLVLNFIHEYRRVRQINPKFEEIAVGIGYSEKAEGTAHTLVEALIAEGWLRRIQPGARMIVPVFPPEEEYAPITDPDLKLIAKRQRNLRILRRM